jgi:phage I-like protein
MDDPAAVIAASNRNKDRLVVDYEHATYRRSYRGQRAPASGWIEELRVKDGAVQGRILWTPQGLNSIVQREYRYLSPTFDFDFKTRTIFRLTSAALTNMPNLRLPALNREEENQVMKMDKRICDALNLAEDATMEQVLAKIEGMKADYKAAKNRAETPSLEEFVPRGDYDTALNRARTAEQKLSDLDEEARKERIETALNQALEAGKITPATVEYHRAQCQAEGGLERFQSYVDQVPEVAGASGLENADPKPAQNRSETGDAARIRRMFGHTEEDLKDV